MTLLKVFETVKTVLSVIARVILLIIFLNSTVFRDDGNYDTQDIPEYNDSGGFL